MSASEAVTFKTGETSYSQYQLMEMVSTYVQAPRKVYLPPFAELTSVTLASDTVRVIFTKTVYRERRYEWSVQKRVESVWVWLRDPESKLFGKPEKFDTEHFTDIPEAQAKLRREHIRSDEREWTNSRTNRTFRVVGASPYDFTNK